MGKPQGRMRVWPKGVTEPLFLAVPLLKPHLLMPLAEARTRALRHVWACSVSVISSDPMARSGRRRMTRCLNCRG